MRRLNDVVITDKLIFLIFEFMPHDLKKYAAKLELEGTASPERKKV